MNFSLLKVCFLLLLFSLRLVGADAQNTPWTTSASSIGVGTGTSTPISLMPPH